MSEIEYATQEIRDRVIAILLELRCCHVCDKSYAWLKNRLPDFDSLVRFEAVIDNYATCGLD